MNKRILALLLALTVLLTLAACRKKAPEETTVPATTEKKMETVPETTEETMPGVVVLEEKVVDPRENTEGMYEMYEDPEPPLETTKPTEASRPTEATQPTQPETTEPSENTQSGTVDVSLTDYERYNAMSASEQEAFIATFDSLSAFVEWYNNAMAEYEAANPPIIVEGDVIELG